MGGTLDGVPELWILRATKPRAPGSVATRMPLVAIPIELEKVATATLSAPTPVRSHFEMLVMIGSPSLSQEVCDRVFRKPKPKGHDQLR